MSTLYEKHNTGDDSAKFVETGSKRDGQTFTPSIAHQINSVKLLLYRLSGTPGTITVSIKATDGSGHPTGADLASGTTNGDTLTTNTAGEWREITLGAGAALAANTKYAIVWYAALASGLNVAYTRWRDDGTDGYSGGNAEYYDGASWSSQGATRDFMFEDWEISAFIPKIFYF